MALCQRLGSITRGEVSAEIGCAPGTAAKDLTALEKAGKLHRDIPNGAVRLTRFWPTC